MSRIAHRALRRLVNFHDFERYAHALVKSRDVDPIYCLVPNIVKHERFEADWFVFVYVSYYSIASALAFCRQMPTSSSYDSGRFLSTMQDIRKFGVERRGTQRRPLGLDKAFNAYKKHQPELLALAREADHARMQSAWRALPGQGDWAAFKLTELHEKALGRRNLAPLDMGLASRDPNSSRGPQGGCRALYSVNPAASFSREHTAEWEELGKSLSSHLGYDLGEVETCLCKWAKVTKGQYYIGHDIHELRELAPLWAHATFGALMRQSGFPGPLWDQPLDTRAAKQAYARRGVLLNAHYGAPGSAK